MQATTREAISLAISVPRGTKRQVKERAIEALLFLAALSSIAVTLGIVAILAYESWNFFQHVPVLDFLTDTEWTVMFINPRYGIMPLVTGTVVTSAVSPREMVARVRAILRRAQGAAAGNPTPSYEKGALKIDFTTYEVSVAGDPVKLTLKEFELLRYLVHNPNRVLNRDQLLDKVWGGDTFVTPRTVDVHIRRLRQAIEKDDRKPQWILTLRGVGYKFNEKALES